MTYYEILKVSPDASKDIIQMAYDALAIKYHPDSNPPELKSECEKNMMILDEAREVLVNEDKRNQYDQELCNPNLNKISKEQAQQFFVTPRPWVRYFARMIDLYFGIILVTFVWIIFSPTTFDKVFGNISNEYVLGAIMYIIWLVIESILISTWGTTLGKWVFSSRVVNVDGGKVRLSKALLRSFSVFLYGLGLSIPLVSFFTLAHSYNRLKESKYGGYTKWDTQTKSAVITEKLKPIKVSIFIIIFVTGILGYKYYSYNQSKINDNYNATIQQLNEMKLTIDKEQTFLANWQEKLIAEYNSLSDLDSKIKQWKDSGNTKEYNKSIVDYNNRMDAYNSEQQQFGTMRVKYIYDSKIYSEKYLEFTKK